MITSMRPIALYRDEVSSPALDMALSRALLDMVAEGFPYDTLRIHQPPPMLALGKLDRLNDGFRDVLNHCHQSGLEPVMRLAGGRAALFHERSLALAFARRESEGMLDIEKRLAPLNDIYLETLRRIGVDARQGELEGEYCPGGSTINARGQVKLIGTGQRSVKGAGHLGSIIANEDGQTIAETLDPVYRAMNHPFEPATCGSILEESGKGSEEFADALIETFANHYEIVEMTLPLEAHRRARDIISQHRII